MLKQIDTQMAEIADGIVLPMQEKGTDKNAILRNLFLFAGAVLFGGLFLPSRFSDFILAIELGLVVASIWLAVYFHGAIGRVRNWEGFARERDRSEFLRDNLRFSRMGTLAVAAGMIVAAAVVVPHLSIPDLRAIFFQALTFFTFFGIVSASFYVMGAPVPRLLDRTF